MVEDLEKKGKKALSHRERARREEALRAVVLGGEPEKTAEEPTRAAKVSGAAGEDTEEGVRHAEADGYFDLGKTEEEVTEKLGEPSGKIRGVPYWELRDPHSGAYMALVFDKDRYDNPLPLKIEEGGWHDFGGRRSNKMQWHFESGFTPEAYEATDARRARTVEEYEAAEKQRHKRRHERASRREPSEGPAAESPDANEETAPESAGGGGVAREYAEVDPRTGVETRVIELPGGHTVRRPVREEHLWRAPREIAKFEKKKKPKPRSDAKPTRTAGGMEPPPPPSPDDYGTVEPHKFFGDRAAPPKASRRMRQEPPPPNSPQDYGVDPEAFFAATEPRRARAAERVRTSEVAPEPDSRLEEAVRELPDGSGTIVYGRTVKYDRFGAGRAGITDATGKQFVPLSDGALQGFSYKDQRNNEEIVLAMKWNATAREFTEVSRMRRPLSRK